jgi:hypothetical protein
VPVSVAAVMAAPAAAVLPAAGKASTPPAATGKQP